MSILKDFAIRRVTVVTLSVASSEQCDEGLGCLGVFCWKARGEARGAARVAFIDSDGI